MIYRCTAISDTHGYHERLDLKGGDFLFHSGDASFFGQPREIVPFIQWLGAQPYTHKVFIAGNHDMGFEPIDEPEGIEHIDGRFVFREREFRKGLEGLYREHCRINGVVYLDKEEVTLDGVRIYGIPNSPRFNNWAFNYNIGGSYCKQLMAAIPKGLDVLLTHSPPYQTLDYVNRGQSRLGDYRTGCEDLLQAVKEKKPRVHIFGHLHDGHGVLRRRHTKFINAAICSHPYDVLQRPINFKLEK